MSLKLFAIAMVLSLSLSATASSSDHPRLGQAIPEAALSDLDAAKLDGQVVYLDFWASWCVPCRRSFPWMNEMQERYRSQGLVIVAINVDKDRALADKFLADYPAKFQIVYDPEAKLASAYDVPGMPTSFIIGRDGIVRKRHIGFRVKHIAEYEAAVSSILNE